MEKQPKISQEMYFLGLVKKANWTYEQAEQLLLTKFETSRWNELTQIDKRRAIIIMKHFVKKAIELKEKKLRQAIYAIWIKSGHSRDELHDVMIDWGFGNSLKALRYRDLYNILVNVKKAMVAPRIIGEKNENKKK